MNDQPLVYFEWPSVAEDLKIKVHNTEIALELLRAQLKEAEHHARGK